MSAKTKVENNHAVTITLEYPFTNGTGEKVEHITMRRPTVKELRESQAKPTPEETELYLMTVLTGLVIEDLELMDALFDYQQLQAALQEMGKPSAKKK